MYRIKVELFEPFSPEAARHQLYKTALAASTCTMTEERILPDDTEKHTSLIKQLLNRGHTSVLEHIVYTFRLSNITRALLQELSRHRMASPTVQSTRWALKKMFNLEEKDLEDFVYIPQELSDDESFSKAYDAVVREMLILRNRVAEKYGNDVAKYLTPECTYCREFLTINCRSLINMFALRSSPRALKEFQELMACIYLVIPAEHKFIYDKFYQN